jgi:hypothetical protein
VFGLSVGALIVFWTVKGTKPAGSAVLPILYGAAIASAVIWLLAIGLGRWKARGAGAQTGSGGERGPTVDQSVTSHSQSGGITARSVKIGRGDPKDDAQ